MFEIAAVFAIFMMVRNTLNVPHLVGKARANIEPGDASRTILLNGLMAIAIYYIWRQHSHTEVREILAITLGAVLAIGTIAAVANIHEPRRIISSNCAAVLVALNVILLVMIVYLVAT